MNKTKLIAILIILGGIVFAGSVLAATNLSFSPANVSVTSGETFNMVVSVNPQGVKNYTVKTEIEFPADLLEVKSFSFGNNWIPLSQSGYDLIDNANGLLIKTAGYPGGLSSVATFGIISFSAKKDGTGTVTLRSDSFALDAENQNLLSGTPQASVVITAPAPAETPPTPEAPSAETPTPEEPTVPVSSEEEEEEETEATTEEEIIAEEEPEQQPEEKATFLAAIGNIVTFGTGNTLIGIGVLIIALVLILFIVREVRLRKSK